MNIRQLLTAALNGQTPDITPYSIYDWLTDTIPPAELARLQDRGLGVCRHVQTVTAIERGVELVQEQQIINGHTYATTTRHTPVGSVRHVLNDGWHQEYYIKTPADYKILTWIARNTELFPAYGSFDDAAESLGDKGIELIWASRSPAMQINIDLAGTERFCMDLALGVAELYELYQARKALFLRETELIAAGPGQFVFWDENLTLNMLGPKRYSELLAPIYDECCPLLRRGGKRTLVHYDGALSAVADQIAASKFDILESLTEPPEGDMTYDQCRQAWPDKPFWANISLEKYYLPKQALRDEVAAKVRRAGKKALALEISEDLPTNWRDSIPTVLDTLQNLGG
jgi:hypothetical protein